MREIETKILEVDPKVIATRLKKLGAKQILKTRLTVDWFRLPNGNVNNDPWFLRIRRQGDGITELTWKSRTKKIGVAKHAQEITVQVNDPDAAATLLNAIGLISYAHQEKDRTSWTLKNWRFDLDRYPGMAPYLEIEGKSSRHILEAIKLLGLEDHRALPEGERTLIQREYGLNWYAMRFE